MTRTYKPNTYSYLKAFIEHQTDKAMYIHVAFTDGKVAKAWVPKSQISNTYELDEGPGHVVLRIADWIINAKGFPIPALDEETKVKLDALTMQGTAEYNVSRMPQEKKDRSDAGEKKVELAALFKPVPPLITDDEDAIPF